MKIRKPKPPPPSCPSAWVIGPYKKKDGQYEYRLHCPVCGKMGIATGDEVSMLHM